MVSDQLCIVDFVSGQVELQGIIETLTREVEGQSNLLVCLLTAAQSKSGQAGETLPQDDHHTQGLRHQEWYVLHIWVYNYNLLR